jgi:hypothetical protein
MIKKIFGNSRTSRERRAFRPEVLALEDRYAPANCVWIGAAGANWNVAANWNNNTVPGIGDTAIFAGPGVGANTDSNMNMGGGVQYHIGKLEIRNGYTGTITLTANLRVDVLIMDGGTIAGSGFFLDVYQRTDEPAFGAATMFATSSWTRGTQSQTGGFFC